MSCAKPKRAHKVSLELSGVDSVDVIILQKNLDALNPQQISKLDFIASPNLFHHALLFRFKRHDCSYGGSIMVELMNRMSSNVVIPNTDDLTQDSDDIDAIDKILLSAEHGQLCWIDVHENVSTACLEQFENGTYVQSIAPATMLQTWKFIQSYEDTYGKLYICAAVVREPALLEKSFCRRSFQKNVRAPVLRDNTCVSFVNRVLDFCISDNVPGVFLPYRNYLAWFVGNEADVRRLDRSDKSDVQLIRQYYSQMRPYARMADKMTQKSTTTDIIARLVKKYSWLKAPFIIVPQWSPHERIVQYYAVKSKSVIPFIAYDHYTILPNAERDVCLLMASSAHEQGKKWGYHY